MSSFVWDSDNVDKLITAVQKFDHVYDASSPSHKDKIMTENSWNAIGLSLGVSGEDCRKKFRNLRDTYNENKRKLRGKSGDGADPSNIKWEHFKSMTWLDDFTKTARVVTNIRKRQKVVKAAIPAVAEEPAVAEVEDETKSVAEEIKSPQKVKSPKKVSPKKGSKAQELRKLDAFQDKIMSHIQHNDTKEMAFAQYVGKTLSSLTKRSKLMAINEINQVLQKYQFADEEDIADSTNQPGFSGNYQQSAASFDPNYNYQRSVDESPKVFANLTPMRF